MNELKPCPFCGGEAKLVKELLVSRYKYFIDISHIDDCILDFQEFHDELCVEEKHKDFLIEYWNTRMEDKNV
jgi:hypothetical protein